MKTFILILWFTTGQVDKVNVNVNIDETCIDALYKVSIWKLNKDYKPGNGLIWGHYTYKNKQIQAHMCIEGK
jgi:hypothetical protein